MRSDTKEKSRMMVFQKLKNGIRYLTDPDFRFYRDAMMGRLDDLPDEEYLKGMFRCRLGYEPDLEAPRTFNEKLQWLKLHDRKPLYTQMVDKAEVKRYVADQIGERYVIPLLGLWDSFDDIDFDSLPDRFVLKCTHDSKGLVICRDRRRFDRRKARGVLTRALARNYYSCGREWVYRDVKPRILAETYMEDAGTKELRDYKFFCFNGSPRCYKVDFDRFVDHRANYFDLSGKPLPIGETACPPDPGREIAAPKNLELMCSLAERLADGIPFLRVDFYEADGRVYFGELTFYPASGFGSFVYEGNDELLGSWLELPGS